MTEQFADDVAEVGTTLTVAVSTTPSAGTEETWTVASTAPPKFPSAGPFSLVTSDSVLGSRELLTVTDVLSATQWTVLRGEGGTISAHAAGTKVFAVLSKRAMGALAQTADLGSAAAADTGDFDPAGAADDAQANAISAAASLVATAITSEASARAAADLTKLAKASNLSDVANAATALANLGGIGPIPSGTYADNPTPGVPKTAVTTEGDQTISSGRKTALGSWHFGSGEPWFDVKAFGAIGDGNLHPLSERYGSLGAAQLIYPFVAALTQQIDWAAIQKACNAATSSPSGQTAGTETPLGAVYMPKGTYRTDGDKVFIRGVEGFGLFGVGKGLSVISGQGSTLAALVELDGAATAHLQDFSVFGNAVGNFPTAGIKLWWNQASGTVRSTTGNTFSRVSVGGWFTHGFHLAGHNQVDTTSFYDCQVGLNWSTGVVTHSQNGWLIGDGTPGNNLTHFLYNCSAANCAVGVNASGSQAFIWGLSAGENGIDVRFDTSAPCLLDTLRSEGSVQAVVGGSGGNNAYYTLRNLDWSSSDIIASGKWISIASSGHVQIQNAKCRVDPSLVVPKVEIVNSSGNTHPLTFEVVGLSQPTPLNTAITGITAGVYGRIQNYTETDSSGAPDTTTTQVSYVNGSILSQSLEDGIQWGAQGSGSPSFRFSHAEPGGVLPDAHFGFVGGSSSFESGAYYDNLGFFGWNGDQAEATEPLVGLSIESKFRQSPSDPLGVEMHLVASFPDATTRRAWTTFIERAAPHAVSSNLIGKILFGASDGTTNVEFADAGGIVVYNGSSLDLVMAAAGGSETGRGRIKFNPSDDFPRIAFLKSGVEKASLEGRLAEGAIQVGVGPGTEPRFLVNGGGFQAVLADNAQRGLNVQGNGGSHSGDLIFLSLDGSTPVFRVLPSGAVTAIGTITGANLITPGAVTATGTVTAANFTAATGRVTADNVKIGQTGAAHGYIQSDDGIYVVSDADNNGGDGSIHFQTSGGATEWLQLNTPGSGETALLARVNDGAVTSVRRVTVGAADSGGAGKRVLVVAN